MPESDSMQIERLLGVDQRIERLLGVEEKIERLLGAEGSEKKLEILHGLMQMPYKERTIKRIAKKLGLSPTTVRVYLNDLRKDGLVKSLDITLSGRDKIWALTIDPSAIENIYRQKQTKVPAAIRA